MAKKIYCSKDRRMDIVRKQTDKHGNEVPLPPFTFRDYKLELEDEDLQKELEGLTGSDGKELLGKLYFEVEVPPQVQTTEYTQGPATTASVKTAGMTAKEKQALTRAKKKQQEGKELTETEAAAVKKAEASMPEDINEASHDGE
jgi:hypothetical protein